jgi:hypothetical protein
VPTRNASVPTVRVVPTRAVSVHAPVQVRVRAKVHDPVRATAAPHRAHARVVHATVAGRATALATATTPRRVPAMVAPTHVVRVPATAVPRVVLSHVAKAAIMPAIMPAAVLAPALAKVALARPVVLLLPQARDRVRVMLVPHQLLDRVTAARVKAAHRAVASASPWECLVATAASVPPAPHGPRAANAGSRGKGCSGS